MATQKPIHSIVIDAGPIIRNEVSRLRENAEALYTTPAIISEIRDEAARRLLETTLMPFLTLRTPTPHSLKTVGDFARKTGDYAVLSRNDLEVIALAYELECELNGGDWRLRSVPGQKRTNGPPPSKEKKAEETDKPAEADAAKTEPAPSSKDQQAEEREVDSTEKAEETSSAALVVKEVEESIQKLEISGESTPEQATPAQPEPSAAADEAEEDSDDSDGGWITPSNLKKHQARDNNSVVDETASPQNMRVATISGDFALQNVLLQMNLNLITSGLQRVKHLRTWILRCHACFYTTKQMDKQFCPRCGKDALTKVSCSTSANGEFKLHLKRNMQWNNRGNRYSVPKAVAGSANGKVKGGGKGGWGNELLLAEDQKEYMRAVNEQKRQKQRDLMDEDYLPAILTGERGKTGGRLKVGAGRNVNSKKRY